MFINTIIGVGLLITSILLGPMRDQLGTDIGELLNGATGGIGIAVIALSLLKVVE